jgi:uncharacterized membrane protein YbhN (UPF0104 family)
MSEAPRRVGREASVNPEAPEYDDDDQDLRSALVVNRRSLIALAGFLLASLAALYFLAPQLAGLDDTWARIEDGRPVWTAAALLLTFGMFAGYVAMFRGVFARASTRPLGWRESYQITLAGLAASRLFAAGGAGGLVLTAWALRRSGMSKRMVADKTISFLMLTYLPYAVAVIVCGFGLHWGLFEGQNPFSLTFLPAVVACLLLAATLAIAFVPTDLQRRLRGLRREGRLGRLTHQLAIAPASTSAGIRDAFEHLRSRDPALIGAVLFWAFQIAVLWAAFHAFGDAPPLAVLVQGFFLGMLGNLLPMPGGVGGVEGGMVGAYAAFGVNFELALVAVLVYRAFTFWLPLVPGVIAYFGLRRTVEGWKRERAAV